MVVDMILRHSLFNLDRISTGSKDDVQIFQRTSRSFSYQLAKCDEIEHT